VWLLAALLLVSSGIVYRVLASRVQSVVGTPVKLPVPLSKFPYTIGGWSGKEAAISNTTKEYMRRNFADDFLSRRYVNSKTNAWADVFVVYCSSRLAGMLGHRPRVCYPAAGWIHDSTEESLFTSKAGRQIPCTIHRFHKPVATGGSTVVLNFYVLNGRITKDEKEFSGIFDRWPNIAGDPAYYVAQIQVSSVLESYVRAAGGDIADLILDFLPDENGEVKSATLYRLVGDAGQY